MKQWTHLAGEKAYAIGIPQSKSERDIANPKQANSENGFDSELFLLFDVGRLEQVERALALGWLGACLVDIAWSAKLSELAARTLHLEGALEELASQHRQLRGFYFRALHEEMDQVIRECMASRRIAEVIAQ